MIVFYLVTSSASKIPGNMHSYTDAFGVCQKKAIVAPENSGFCSTYPHSSEVCLLQNVERSCQQQPAHIVSKRACLIVCVCFFPLTLVLLMFPFSRRTCKSGSLQSAKRRLSTARWSRHLPRHWHRHHRQPRQEKASSRRTLSAAVSSARRSRPDQARCCAETPCSSWFLFVLTVLLMPESLYTSWHSIFPSPCPEFYKLFLLLSSFQSTSSFDKWNPIWRCLREYNFSSFIKGYTSSKAQVSTSYKQLFSVILPQFGQKINECWFLVTAVW